MPQPSAERIVSLIPNATEMICAIGLGDSLVGRSHECDHPAWVRRLPAVTASNLDPALSSGEIDRDVRRLLSRALSLYEVDRAAMQSLRPDLVVTQDLCDVCAVSLPDVERVLADLTGGAPRLVSLKPNTLDDVWDDIGRLGAAAGVPDAAQELAANLADRVRRLAARVADRPRPRVAALEWFEPLMAGGNWVPELVEAAGGTDVLGARGGHAPTLDWATLAAADPDVIVTMPCGFDIARSRQELSALTAHPEWSRLKAVREGQVYLSDGNQYFNRPGPRLAESAEILVEILHPDVASFGHEGHGWVRLEARG